MADGTRTGVKFYVGLRTVAANGTLGAVTDVTNWALRFVPPKAQNSAGSNTGAGDDDVSMQGRERAEWTPGTFEFLDSVSTGAPWSIIKTAADAGGKLAIVYRASSAAIGTANPSYTWIAEEVSGLGPPEGDTSGDGTATSQSVTFTPRTKPTEATS